MDNNNNKTHELEQQISQLKLLLNHQQEQLDDEREFNRATKHKTNGGFYMTSRSAEKNLRVLQKESPNGALVFSVLREHMKIGTNAVTISSVTLAKILSKSLRTITRAIRYLTENNYVQIIKTGTSNTYIINERISFSGSVGQRKAVFSATVVAHEAEQEAGWDKAKELIVITADIERREPLSPPDRRSKRRHGDSRYHSGRRIAVSSKD